MNKSLLRSEMVKHKDTQETLARFLGLSLSRLNAKINGWRGASFTQTEIERIQARYELPPEMTGRIFFTFDAS